MIYFDNAATTFPKPPEMWAAMVQCGKEYCGNPGRSGHAFSLKTGRGIFEARREIAELFGCRDSSGIVFTENATGALNTAIKGVLRSGDHVITTAMEHNSVLRPVKAMEKVGVENTILKCESDGTIDPERIKRSIKENTRLIVCTHASNVTGSIMPIAEIGAIAREKEILFLLDASQTAGCYPIDVNALQVDMLAAPGHKGLLGPQGTGVLYVRPGIKLEHYKEGGTGTESKNLRQPTEFPEGYESGTPNSPGIIGLCAAIKWIRFVGVETIREHEERLLKLLDEGLQNIDGVEVYGPRDIRLRAGIASFNIKEKDCEEVADRLNQEYGVAVRAGFHCAALAHKTIGTGENGTVRASLGPFNTKKEVLQFLRATQQIAAD